ncbi:MAG: hypothetical protein IKK52_02380 [Alphaproteobacteria bacterium]|nr:hypothetical protein [Alphaproteobacteria bacterium]
MKKIGELLLASALVFGICGSATAKVEKKDLQSVIQEHFSEKTVDADNYTVLDKKDAIASLRFVWNSPVNVASFVRNGKIWMVFDKVSHFDVAILKKEAKGLAKEIYTLPHPAGSVVIIEPEEGVKHTLRKEGLLWIVDLYVGRAPLFERKDITIFTQFDSFKNTYLFMPTTFVGNIVSILDPEIGDAVSIFTTPQLGLGNSTFYRYPDFDILETLQGMAFVMNAPDIALDRGNSGVTLKAIGRSLNITSDLDSLKQQQVAKSGGKETEVKSPFDLHISQQLASKKFLNVIDDFKSQILSAPMEEKNMLRIKLAQYYVYNGMGTDAVYILDKMLDLDLPETRTDYFHALLGVADFLAHRWQKAEKHFSFGRIQDTIEGRFWKIIAQTAYKFEEKNNELILKHISLMRDYPQAIKDQIAIIAARNAIKGNDDLSAQNFIDILNSVQDRFRNLKPQITYLLAQKLEMQGYLRNAVKEYQTLLNSNSAMFSAYGRLRYTVLSQMVNFIDVKAAITELEKLRFAWGERSFQINLLAKLADFYLKDKDYYNALRVLNEEGFIVDEEERLHISRKMVKVFEDVFIGNHADEALTPIKALALYEDFRWLGDLSSRRNTIMQKLADRLVSVDLLPRAKDILLNLLMQDDLGADDMARVGARLAVIYLFERIPEQSLDILDATYSDKIAPEIEAPRKFIRAKAYAEMGKVDKALEVLQDDYSLNALKYRFEIYWNSQDWDNASNVIKYLIKEPVKGQPLSKEQISYILDWATALKKAGKETVLVRLRKKFKPYFEGTSYASIFNVLTERLERDEVDINTIRSAVNDIQDFNSFIKFYNNSLEEKIEQAE